MCHFGGSIKSCVHNFCAFRVIVLTYLGIGVEKSVLHLLVSYNIDLLVSYNNDLVS